MIQRAILDLKRKDSKSFEQWKPQFQTTGSSLQSRMIGVTSSKFADYVSYEVTTSNFRTHLSNLSIAGKHYQSLFNIGIIKSSHSEDGRTNAIGLDVVESPQDLFTWIQGQQNMTYLDLPAASIWLIGTRL